MPFLQLNRPSNTQQLGQCIANIYHHSQFTSLESFKQHCYQHINEIVELGVSLWLIQKPDNYSLESNTSFITQFQHDEQLHPEGTFALTPKLSSWIEGLTPTLTSVDEVGDFIPNLRNVVACRIQLPQSGVTHTFMFTPKEAKSAFTQNEIESLNLLIPHMAEAFKLNILSSYKSDSLQRLGCFAICELDGAVTEMNDGFYRLLMQVFPDWQRGQSIPVEIRSGVLFLVKDRVLFKIEQTFDLYHIEAIYLDKVFSSLTNKEKQVCFYLKKTWPNQAIADALGISRKTLENHLANIYVKTGKSGRSALIAQLAD